MGTVTERIQVKITQDGAKAVRRDIEGVGAGADKAGSALGNFARIAKAAVAAAAVRETIRLADSYTDLSNKIRFATSSERDMISVREELFRVANQNRASIETTADVYGKLRLSTQALGLSQNEVIELTDTLQKATVLSGASAESAANSLRQLGQGMASGALRGDELNSVLENTPYIAQVIAESLGKDIGAIRKMGAEGQITGKIIADAFKGAREEIVDRFGERIPTVGESLTVMMNVATKLVGEIDAATGASGGLAKAIIDISEGVNDLIPQIAELAAQLGDFSELKDALSDLLPDMDGDGVTSLQFITLMFSTLEDRVIGIARAAAKMWAALSFGMEDMPEGSLLADLGDIVTGQGDVTARVLETINQQRNGRRGTTTINADPNDPSNTLDRKGPNTSAPATEKAKGRSFSEIITELERENALLQMNNDERKITEAYIKAFEDSAGNLTKGQLDQVEVQLRKNAAIEIEKRDLDQINERIDKQLELEQEAMKLEQETQSTYEETLRSIITERELWQLTNQEREIAVALLNAQAAAQGRLTDEQMKSIEAELRTNQSMGMSNEMPGDFEGATKFMDREFIQSMRTFGQEMAIIFGPGGTLQQGLEGVVGNLSDAIGYSIAFGQSWNDTAKAIENIGRSIVAEIISALIRIPIQMGINAVVSSAIRAKETSEAVAQAAVVTAAGAAQAGALAAVWSTPAALVSAATFGAAAAAGTASIAGSIAAVKAMSATTAVGFEDGGYTGSAGRSSVAGLVHGQEFVLHADATRRYRADAEAMNAGTYRRNGGGSPSVNVIVNNNAPGVQVETRQLDEQNVEMIVRRLAPQAVADDLNSSYSKVGKAMTRTTTAKRTRA